MNNYIEKLSSLNADGKFGQEFTGGKKPLVTFQEISGAMTGLNREYTDFVMNIVHKHPCKKDTRDYLSLSCISAHKEQEQIRHKLYKDKKPLDDDECIGLARMAIDWMIQGYLDLTEQQVCNFASQYLTKTINKSTWVKKYENSFIVMLHQLQQGVQDVCNAAKENTGIYE